MICLYQTRPDKGKSKLLLRPQTLVVSAPRSRIEYLDFGDFKILSSMDPWIKIIMIKIMENRKIRYPKSQNFRIMNYYHRRIAEKKLTKIYRQNNHDILISKSTDSKIFIGKSWKSLENHGNLENHGFKLTTLVRFLHTSWKKLRNTDYYNACKL